MTRGDKTLDAVLRGASDVSFREFDKVAKRLGFVLDRVSGSHHIYVHPKVSRPLSVQPVGKDVKRYQLKQFRSIVREFGLEPGE